MEKTIDQFIKENGLTATFTKVPENPNMADAQWRKDSRHYHVQIKNGKPIQGPDTYKVNTYFSVGAAWLNQHAPQKARGTMQQSIAQRWGEDSEVDMILLQYGKPELRDVLDCLAMDSSGVYDGQEFEAWASDYGYDTDSRKAENTFNLIKKQTKDLKALLGESAFKELIESVERL